MYVFELQVEHPLEYKMTGKFEAPSNNWIHEDFSLNDFELIIVTEGVLYITYSGKNFTVSSGEFLLMPPLSPPNNRRKGFQSSRCSFYWLHFSCNFKVHMDDIHIKILLEHSFVPTKNSLLVPQQAVLPNSEKIVVLMKQLQDAVKTNHNEVLINFMSTVVLCELNSQFCERNALNSQNKKTQKQMYNDIIDFVKQNVHTSLKVTDVAQHFGYNEKYLSHLFSNIAGIPLKQFILTTKMDMANFMLIDTNKSIYEIALSLGFSDSHHFAKAYKKICGLTPTEYRNAFSKRLLYHI
jgi:AraC-like DNA-binding protein